MSDKQIEKGEVVAAATIVADALYQLAESVCEGLIDLAKETKAQRKAFTAAHTLARKQNVDLAEVRRVESQGVELRAREVMTNYVDAFHQIAEALQAQNGASEAQGSACELTDKYSTASYQAGRDRGSAEGETTGFSAGWQRGYEMGYREGQDWEREKQGLDPVEPEEEEEVEIPDTIIGGQMLSYTFDTLDECLERVLSCYAYSTGLVDKVEFEAERMDDGEWMMKVNLQYRRPAHWYEKGEDDG